MIASFVAWRRRRKIRRLGRKVARLKLRKAKDMAYLAYWARMFVAGTEGYKDTAQCNIEADLNARIAAATCALGELEPQLLELEKAELGIGLWQVEREQAATLAHVVLASEQFGASTQTLARAVLSWAEPQ